MRFNLSGFECSRAGFDRQRGNPIALPEVTWETSYRGPTTAADLRIAGRTIRVVRPTEPDRLLDDAQVVALNRALDYMPYWAYLWPGSILLAEAVLRRAWSGESAIEIGCGLGLGGLAAVAAGLTVRFTDHDAAPLAFVRRSVQANGFDPARVATARLDWADPGSDRHAVVLGSDVLYERRLVPIVADLLATVLGPDGLALIADPDRDAARSFPAEVGARGLRHSAEPIDAESDEFGTIRGTIHVVRR